MNHHPSHLMKHFHHDFHHEHRHHNEGQSACGKFGRRGNHFKHHGPTMEKRLGERKGRQHGGFGKCGIFEKPLIHSIGQNTNVNEQIQQIVRAFFNRRHQSERGCCSASVNTPVANVEDSGIVGGTTPTEGAAGTGNMAGQCQKGRNFGGHGRRGFRRRSCILEPCKCGQGRNILDGQANTEDREAPLCDGHCQNGRGFRRCHGQGRSTQEEPLRNKDTEQQAGADQSCKRCHHYDYGRRHEHEIHPFRRFGRHGCCIIFVDSSIKTGMAQELNQEVSCPENTTEAMETTEENQASKDTEDPEVQKNAD